MSNFIIKFKTLIDRQFEKQKQNKIAFNTHTSLQLGMYVLYSIYVYCTQYSMKLNIPHNGILSLPLNSVKVIVLIKFVLPSSTRIAIKKKGLKLNKNMQNIVLNRFTTLKCIK